MPYCTIEEAWSQSINPDLQSQDFKPNTNNNYPDDYSNIELEQSELYNKKGNKFNFLKKKKKSRKAVFQICLELMIDYLNTVVTQVDLKKIIMVQKDQLLIIKKLILIIQKNILII